MTKRKIQDRKEAFTERTATRIWQEVPSQENPYIAELSRCHGYDLLELMQHRSFIDVVYLLIRGELPTADQSQLLETLFVGLINPGPRHAATRAAMNAGVGKTDPAHILPIGLSVLGGAHLGGTEVTKAMEFIKASLKKDPTETKKQLATNNTPPAEGDWHIAPGFGTRFGSIDAMAKHIADKLLELPSKGNALQWSDAFSKSLQTENMGWLLPGVAAAVFLDLGFHPRAGVGLFQLACSPGLLAHGLEFANKPRTAMPFPDDDHYIIEEQHEKA